MISLGCCMVWLELTLTVSYRVWGSAMLTADEARKLTTDNNPILGLEHSIKQVALHGGTHTNYRLLKKQYSQQDIDLIAHIMSGRGYKVDVTSIWGENNIDSYNIAIDWGE